MTTELRAQAQTDLVAERAHRQVNTRASSARWTEATGAQLLVVDPREDETGLSPAMSSRGVHVTWVSSTLDALLEFGRTNPSAVIVAPDAQGIPTTEFIAKVCEYGPTFVIAGLAAEDATTAGRMILAGAGAVLTRPYTADEVWGVLERHSHALDDHARVSLGPIELDDRAYTVRVNGERLPDLPLKEFELLRLLLFHAPDVLSDEDLRTSLWGSERPANNTIAVHAARLRGRLDGVARIRRIRGRGYSLTLN